MTHNLFTQSKEHADPVPVTDNRWPLVARSVWLRFGLVTCLATSLISGCAGEAAVDQQTQSNSELVLPGSDSLSELAETNPTSSVVLLDAVPNAASDNAQIPVVLPSVETSVTLADTGLQVGYIRANLQDSIDELYIEEQWTQMQSCLQVTAASPLIIVVSGFAAALTPNDDVLHHIDGSTTATSSRSDTGSIIQITAADFDGSLGIAGFNLRSIMGRYLWLAAGLEERDYPYQCARSIDGR